jgi:molecular chaperone GrpE
MKHPEDQENLEPQEDLQDQAEASAQESDAQKDPQQEKEDLLARLQRVSADYANYQKRTAREFQQAREFANEQILRSLLGVLDDMERALEAARENHDESDPLLKGMQLVHDKLLDTLKQFGLARIEAEGKSFDPDLHQAMMRQPTSDQPPMTVLQEVQKGYSLKGRTLRPAGVIVSTAPEGQDASGESVDVEA